MIYSLLVTSFYVWSFGQLLSFILPGISFTVYLLDLITGLLLLSLIISPNRKEIFKTPLTKSLIIFVSFILFSFFLNLQHAISAGILTSFLYLVRLFIYPSYYFAINYLGFAKLKKHLGISVMIFLVLGLFQYLFFPDMRFLKNLGFDDHYYRLIGTFFDPNFTGAILSGLSLYLISQKKYLHTLPVICLLALTFSRASYVCFAVGLIYILITQKKIKLVFLAFLLALIVYFIPKPFGEGVNLARTFSIYSRLDSWQQGITIFQNNPFFGFGYNNLRGQSGARFQIDNSLIYIMATAGIFGFISFLNLLWTAFKNSNQAVRAVLISLIIHSLFNNTLFYIWISAALWLVLGIGNANTKAYKRA